MRLTSQGEELVRSKAVPLSSIGKKALLPTRGENVEKYTGLFDLSEKGAYIPPRKKRAETREVENINVSVYLSKDEIEHLEKLADKYNTSKSNIIRILVSNAK